MICVRITRGNNVFVTPSPELNDSECPHGGREHRVQQSPLNDFHDDVELYCVVVVVTAKILVRYFIHAIIRQLRVASFT